MLLLHLNIEKFYAQITFNLSDTNLIPDNITVVDRKKIVWIFTFLVSAGSLILKIIYIFAMPSEDDKNIHILHDFEIYMTKTR